MSLSEGKSSPVSMSSSSLEETTHSITSATSNTMAIGNRNLGDVTAKAGSQAIAASLLGTAIGIVFSMTFCSDHGSLGMFAGFLVLSAAHQVCTYWAVKAVPLRSLDRHRLHIFLTAYIGSGYYTRCNGRNRAREDGKEGGGRALTPAQVAERECFLPMVPPDDSVDWLTVGASLEDICPAGVAELEGLLLRKGTTRRGCDETSGIDDPKQHERYILKIHPPSTSSDGMVQLTFCDGATDIDRIRGMFHAYLAHESMKRNGPKPSFDRQHAGSQILMKTHAVMISRMPTLEKSLDEAGWHLGMGLVNVECGSSYRLKIQHC